MKHVRRSIRLPGYDYSEPGEYFVTLVTQNRVCRFGCIVAEEFISNGIAEMIIDELTVLPKRYANLEVDLVQLMPNHLHAILVINPLDGTTPTPTLGGVIGAFKSITTRRYIQAVTNLGWEPFEKRLWQRNYYEHIIRNENEYEVIANYIQNNPSQWLNDEEFRT